jgi:quinol monooxygenase YgiN
VKKTRQNSIRRDQGIDFASGRASALESRPAFQARTKDREDFVIYVVATLSVKPETRAEFISAATACIKETRKEPGNIAYDLHESVTDPSKMVFVEQWENAEALVPHRAAEHMKTFGRVAVKCFSAPPRIEIITPEKVEVR